jgi:hypothetical protein|tara:strand:- start:598 stop:1083 length:486 start_codon:yes stop_codon:yes gene_type:complete
MGAVKMIAILIIVLVLAGGLWHVSNLKANLAISKANSAKLEQGIKEQQYLVDKMQEDVAMIQGINKQLQDENVENLKEIKKLTDKFNVKANGDKRDFGTLAAVKPKVIQRLINRGTKNAVRCLEILTGAPHTEKELNAKLQSETNRECQSIANPNYIPTTP